MSYSEKALLRIQEIAHEQGVDIVEATSLFCEENNIDVHDFIKMIDKNFIDLLKYTAIEMCKVRKSVAKPTSKLPI
jgi:hypothetical protein